MSKPIELLKGLYNSNQGCLILACLSLVILLPLSTVVASVVFVGLLVKGLYSNDCEDR